MKKPTVLMVESDLPTVELYVAALKPDYDVVACSDEAGVLDVLSTNDLDAVILEPAVGGGRGWAIFSAIRGAIREHSIPVIVCSTLDERKRGLEMGAAAFLVKPVLPGMLLETLRQFRRSRKLG